MTATGPKTSIVLPLCNERESLAELHAELAFACDGLDVEFVFVDDGSDDGSWDVLASLARSDPRVRAVRLRRNFGKAAALTAGFREAGGSVVLTMDADLQDDPAEIPRFLNALASGKDVVSGWKKKRHDPWHKVGPSRLFNAVVSTWTGCRLHDHNCGFKAYRAKVLAEVEIYGELHRFIPVLAHARGFLVGEIEVHHRARRFGQSKYGLARLVKGFLDLVTVRFLTTFRQRPMHLMGALGFGLLLAGGSGMIVAGVAGSIAPLIVFSCVLGIGAQLVFLGLVAELLTSFNLRPGETYSVAERIAPPSEPEQGSPRDG